MKPYGNFSKLYEEIRRYDLQRVAVTCLKELHEIEEIWRFYEKISIWELRIIHAAIKKTEAQLGYIPFCFSTVPFVFFIFSGKISTLLSINLIYLFVAILMLSVILVILIHRHFKHKSYNKLHLHIVESQIQLREKASHPAEGITPATETSASSFNCPPDSSS